MMEWNVHESTQGSGKKAHIPTFLWIQVLKTMVAAMWDSHFRVGGGYFSDLTRKECPKSTSDPDRNCMAALILLHVTPTSSGYFENVWVW